MYITRNIVKDGKPIEGVYEDINGDGIINQNDLYRYKSPFPKYTFGFTTQFTYKRWTLNILQYCVQTWATICIMVWQRAQQNQTSLTRLDI